jgi:hypothetical protein
MIQPRIMIWTPNVALTGQIITHKALFITSEEERYI